jgi:PIN domain
VTRLNALLDACVLVPYDLGDVLLRAADSGLYALYLSEKILDEAKRNRIKRGKDKPLEEQAKIAQRVQGFGAAVMKAFPDAIVEAPPDIENMMTNHFGDRHVLASAVYTQKVKNIKVDFIVTRNLKHFPREALDPYGIRAIHPDDFLLELCDSNADEIMYDVLKEKASKLKKSADPQQPHKIPPVTTLEFIHQLEKEQPKFSSRMLIYKYYDEMIDMFTTILRAGRLYNNQRYLDGINYKICSENFQIIVIDKSDSRIVLKIDEDDVSGDLKFRDVKYFKEFRDEASDVIDMLAARS